MSNISYLKNRIETWKKQENEAKDKFSYYNEIFKVIPTFRNLYDIENGSSISFETIKNKQFNLSSIEETIEKNIPKNSFIKKEENKCEVIFNELLKEDIPPIHRRTFNYNTFKKSSEFFRSSNITLNFLEKKFTRKGMHRSEGTNYYIQVDYLDEPYLFKIERYESILNSKDWIIYLIATNEEDVNNRSYVMEQLFFWFKNHSPERLNILFQNQMIKINHSSFPYINESLKKYVNTIKGGVPISGTGRLKELGYDTIFDLLELTIQELDQLIENQYRFIQIYFWVKEAGLSFKNESN